MKTDSTDHPKLRLRIMAEYTSSGIWVVEPSGPFRHGMISHKKLGLPARLALKFRRWIDEHDARLPEGSLDRPKFNRRGRALTRELPRYLGPGFAVEYDPIEESDDPALDSAILEWIGRDLARPAKRKRKK